MLEGQCLSWAGPISAAVYLPTDPLDEPEGRKAAAAAREELAQLHARLEGAPAGVRSRGGLGLETAGMGSGLLGRMGSCPHSP